MDGDIEDGQGFYVPAFAAMETAGAILLVRVNADGTSQVYLHPDMPIKAMRGILRQLATAAETWKEPPPREGVDDTDGPGGVLQ